MTTSNNTKRKTKIIETLKAVLHDIGPDGPQDMFDVQKRWTAKLQRAVKLAEAIA